MKPSLFIPLLLFVACKGNSGRENPLADLDKSSEAVMEEFLCLDSIDAFGVNDFAVTDSVLWFLFQRPGSEDVLAQYRLGDNSCKSVIKLSRIHICRGSESRFPLQRGHFDLFFCCAKRRK